MSTSKSKVEMPSASASTEVGVQSGAPLGEEEEEEFDDGGEAQGEAQAPRYGETQVDTATKMKESATKLDEDEDYDPCGEEEEEGDEIEVIEVDQKKRKTMVQDSDDAEVDFENLVREEFKKLHRQYRLMEDARHAIAGASGKLSMQGRLLERLKDEKEDLMTDLKNASCKAYRNRDKESINTILEALERYEKYKADITACLLSIAEMESNVDKISQKLVEQRLKVQALYGQSMTVSKAEHRKRILEDKLYLVTTQTDTLVSDNKDLRANINMMLKLRGSFYRRMVYMKKVSAKIKQKMGEVVYEATAAYDQRADWVNKINILRERNDKDNKQHVVEMKEFQRMLHHDSSTHEFLAIKNQDRELLENVQQRLERKNKVKIAELDQLLRAYKKSFKAVLVMAESKDIDTLVSTYLEEEHTNYAMFKYVTDLNQETTFLEDAIERIKKEIQLLSAETKERARLQQEALDEVDGKVQDAAERLEIAVKDCQEADKILEECSKLLEEAFNTAGCSKDDLVTLGNKGVIGPHTMNLCVKSLEHRIAELLYDKATLEIRKAVEVDGNPLPKKPQLWTPGTKPAPQGGPFKPVVHVTGRVDSEQEDEQEVKAWSERPIYYHEMKDVIIESMQQMQDKQGDHHHQHEAPAAAAPATTTPATTTPSKAPTAPPTTTPSEAVVEPEPEAEAPPPPPPPEPEPEPAAEEENEEQPPPAEE